MPNKRPKNYDKLKSRPLSAQQRDFVLYYISNGRNATKAALDAGYSPKNASLIGWQLVHTTANVSAEIERISALASKNAEVDATYVLRSLKEVADACKVKRVLQDDKGNPVEGGVVDSAGANRSLELLGKNLRLWVEVLDLNRKTELDELSDDELLKIMRRAKAAQDKEAEEED